MSKTIFDIETSGLDQRRSNILQFAYMEIDDDLSPIRQGSIYLKPYTSDWTAGAEAVHKLSKPFLMEHGVEPEYGAANIWALLYYRDILTYNGKTFDLPLVNNYCQAVGTSDVYVRDHYDLCLETPKLYGGKRRKLVDAVQEFGIKASAIERLTSILFGEPNHLNPHDARYDVVATYMLYKKVMQRVQ